jgi:hypothetical protein
MHTKTISGLLKNFKRRRKMKKIFYLFAGLFFLFGCSDNPPSTAVIVMPADVTVKSSADVSFLITAIVRDREDENIRYNNMKVLFLCMKCEFVNEENPTQVEKRTDSMGVAKVWVKVKVGDEAVVSGTLENGSGASTKLSVSAP